MNKEQYKNALERVSRYEKLTKKLDEVTKVAEWIDDGRSVKVSVIRNISFPVEVEISNPEQIKLIRDQLEIIKLNLEEQIAYI